MKTLIIGDIHGCVQTLKDLLAKAGPVDEIISVGDLIDRGPNSYAVIKLCQELNIKTCLGNHELMAIEAIDHYLDAQYFKLLTLKESDWFYNGGQAAFKSIPPEELANVSSYLKTLPIYIETEHKLNGLPVVVSHTALNTLADTLPTDNTYTNRAILTLIWNRQQSHDRCKFFSIYGHTINTAPIISPTGINLDTGCFLAKEPHCLTAALLEDDSYSLISVPYKG